MKRLIATLVLLLGLATPAAAQLGSVPYTFTPGSVISSSQMNTMFSAIYSNACNRTGCTLTGAMTTLAIAPTADNVSDIGSAALSYNDGWFDGTLTVATLAATSITGTFSGTLSTTARITATVTTEQIRAAYDASNYLSFTVASNGAATIDATGAGAAVTFSDIVAFTLGLKERGRSVLVGEWADQAYNAADYTSPAGSWTVDSGDLVTNRYTLVGKTLIWQINIKDTDLSAGHAHLRVAIPNSMTASAHIREGGCGSIKDNGAVDSANGLWVVASGGTYVQIFRAQKTAFNSTSSDNADVNCTVVLEIA